MELFIFPILIMGFLNLLKNLNAFTFMMNAIVVISELLPIASLKRARKRNQRGS